MSHVPFVAYLINICWPVLLVGTPRRHFPGGQGMSSALFQASGAAGTFSGKHEGNFLL